MKKLLSLIILIVCVSFFVQTKNSTIPQASAFPTKANQDNGSSYAQKTFIFIPYWTIDENVRNLSYDALYYFGLEADRNGIIEDESGYKKLSSFVQAKGEKSAFLTIRMLNTKENLKILENEDTQKIIIVESTNLAHKYGFKGIVLDFEVSSLPFDSVKQQINHFVELFVKETNQRNLLFQTMIYGDVFYRLRPYDVPFIAQHSEKILVMAYDLNKPSGNPGPNFPLFGKDTYGYDFSLLVDNFLVDVPKSKLAIVLGMYGYDWQVDINGHVQKDAQPLSSLVVKRNFIDKCTKKQCVVKRDNDSSEIRISYIDEDNTPHVIWAEDELSQQKKSDFLKQKGIESIGFWAYSYF